MDQTVTNERSKKLVEHRRCYLSDTVYSYHSIRGNASHELDAALVKLDLVDVKEITFTVGAFSCFGFYK